MPSYDLFISYRRPDAPRVRPLVDCLRGLGLEIWIDENEIEDFAAVTRTITEGLAQSKAVLAWYSAIYPDSRPCQWELTAAYLAAQQDGDPRQRVLIVNPETSPDHIALPELKDQQYLSAPAMEDQAGYVDLAKHIAAQVRGLAGTLGDIRPLVTPAWFPYTPTGSARFVGRLRHMWQIHDALWRGQTVIGQLKQGTALAQLVGGGGMGKSLLAEEYALRYGAAYPGGVFWLSARTEEVSGVEATTALAQQREQQWRNLAAWLGMEIKEKTLIQIDGALYRYFADKGCPFLWVVDDVPRDVSVDELKRWYATHPLGKTLVTTRSHEYAALGGVIEVGVLAEAEARSLLTRQRPPADDSEVVSVAGILTALGRHALAVDVAAARLKGKPYPEFLTDLHNPDKDAIELANQFAGLLPNGHEASIATTLLQSIDNVGEATRDLLRLAAELALAPIPRRLVSQVFARADGLSDSDAQDRADLALHEAQEQSLAEATGDIDFCVTVHVLVARTMRFHAANSERSTTLRTAVVQALTAELAAQAGDIRYHVMLVNWIGHARHLVAGTDEGPETIELCDRLARYEYERGAYSDAEGLMVRALSVRQRMLGEENPHTMSSKHFLASILRTQCKLGAARILQEQVLAMNLSMHGEEHPHTLASMNNLGLTLQALGELVAARAVQEQVLALQRRVLGEEHPDTVTSMNNLALTIQAQGELVEARALQEQVLALRRRMHGEEHPATLTSMDNLGVTQMKLGELVAARTLEEHVLGLRKRIQGEDHPDTLMSMSQLAATLHVQGELIAARSMQDEVMSVRLRVLGEEHTDTLLSMNNLAVTLRSLGELGEARVLLDKALDVSRRVLGNKHPLTLSIMNNIADTLRGQDELAHARALQEEVLALRMQEQGKAHPDTLSAMSNLADSMRAQGELVAARTLQENVLALRQQVLGETHSDTLLSMGNLAVILGELGELNAARDMQQQVLEVSNRVLGGRHSGTTVAAWNLVRTLQQEGLQDQVSILAQKHLAWMLEIAPEALSADQLQIRERLVLVPAENDCSIRSNRN